MRSDNEKIRREDAGSGVARDFNPSNGPSLAFGTRIARKIFLGYMVPLAVLLVAGLLIPLFLWFGLDHFRTEYEAETELVTIVSEMRHAAMDTEGAVNGLRRVPGPEFREQLGEARNAYRDNQVQMRHWLEENPDPIALRLLESSDQPYRDWLRETLPTLAGSRVRVAPPFRPGRQDAGPDGRQNGPGSRVAPATFARAQTAFDTFLETARSRRDAASLDFQRADLFRKTAVGVVPTVALVLALLVGRSIALGIARPLVDLTQATESMAKVGPDADPTAAVLLLDADADPNDEIGDLRKAFRNMAHTIGQREAVQRAQNEALGSISGRVESVLNATNDGIAMLDRSGAFSVVNERFAYLLGMTVETLLDQPFGKMSSRLLDHFQQRDLVRRRLRAVLRAPEAVADEIFEMTYPVSRTLRFFTAPVHRDWRNPGAVGDELLGRIIVLRDVTREMEADRLKNEFVSTVSHELRTPLTAIGGYIELILGGKTGDLTQTQHDFLTLARGSVERLTLLINDILDISRIEAGGSDGESESIAYGPLIHEAVGMLSEQAREKNQSLTVRLPEGEPVRVVGDARRIHQALTNLISNAIKYTPPDGSISVAVECHDTALVTTRIADSGIGIGPDDQERIFEKFFRADNSSTRETGGTGLGLVITRAIVEKLGGSIWLESASGKGSTFFFTLPQPQIAGADDVSAPASDTPQSRKLYLIVDGDTLARHRLAHALRDQDVIVSTASTPADARRRAKNLRPDAILYAPLSPGMNGLSALRLLQNDPTTASIPVYLYSLRQFGARAEASDTIHLIPSLETPAGEDALRRAVELLNHRDDRRERPLVILMSATLADRVRDILSIDESLAQIPLLLAATTEDAEQRLGPSRPHAIVLDAAACDNDNIGAFVSALAQRHPNIRIPVFLVGAPESPVQALVTPGAGPLALQNFTRSLT